MESEIEIRLRPGREKSVVQGHPWLFSGAIASAHGSHQAPVARVLAADGRLLGRGFYSPRSQIRVRLLGGPAETVDRAFFAARLAEAAALRRAVVPSATTGYRLLNSEGDGVPGWTVDRYGEVLVSQITVTGLEALRTEAYGALAEALPETAIVHQGDLGARREEGLSLADEVVRGELPSEARFLESGFTFFAELGSGQKSGFYLDQRENRRLVERLASQRRVLDLFAHSGAFGLYALRGGARSVAHVESAPRLIERGRRHYAENGLSAAAVEWIPGDVFADLRERQETYDLAIVDPPPLARRQADRERAARAYKDLNRLVLRRLAPGGLLLTFSCSGAVDAKLFRQILFAAALEARVRLALLAPLAAAGDHPVAVTHPQGEYLKGWLAVVQGPMI